MDSLNDFVHRLTDNAKGSLEQADMIARSLGSAYIGTEHLLLGVLSQETSVGAKMLADAGITLERARIALNLTPRALVVSTGAKGLSETAKLTLRMSWDVAQEFHQDYCGTEHILFSILSQKNARATVLLRDMNVSIDELLGDIENYLNRQHIEHDVDQPTQKSKRVRRSKHQALDTFGSDLTHMAKERELDPVIGRDEQIARMITILSRRTKNNPILIGEPGVGKTAIVEGLAQRIASEDVPDHLLDKQIYQLDLAAMVAGTKYRGEFEERLKKVVEELTADDDLIVFIDELHLLIGAGAAEGSMDAANILKPALARGKLRLIGATTLDEYRKHIEKDAAFERRLQPIVVGEPSLKDTRAILSGMREKYEEHHGVKVSDELIEDVVYLADRYINERFMPDKALDVLDEASSLVRVQRGKTPQKAREYQQEIRSLSEKMEDAVASQDYERAALYKMRISRLKEQIAAIKKPGATMSLSYSDIAHAVATMSGVPVQQLKRSEANLLRKLETHLSKHLIGQREAIETVSKAVRRSRSGIGESKRPIGSFIFMGPTGVGKTELARVLAREVFGSEKALIKIDMSEFGERHTASRLVGAPAGYVGYDDGGQLTDKVRRQPYSVVLFDEIEKAHPDVANLLLQLLEDGSLTDAKGRRVDFSNTIIILTSNLGAQAMQKEAVLGFSARSEEELKNLESVHEENKRAAMEALEKRMRPELINRFDSIVVFHSLSRDDVSKIFDLLVENLRARINRKGIGLHVTPSAKKWLIEKGYDSKHGARPLRRVIQNELEHTIAEGVLSGEYAKGDILNVKASRGRLEITRTQEAEKARATHTQ